MSRPFAATLQSEDPARAEPVLQRTRGEAAIVFKAVAGRTRLENLRQNGSAKIRLPKVEAGAPPLAVLINTAGGLTGGDRLSSAVTIRSGARATVTTQACEKIYRSAGGDAEVTASLNVGEGARLDWLPQQTILFDGARLSRRLEANLAADATLLAVEATIFGRTARGERVRSGFFRDRWRIHRNGKLIFADDLRFDWAVAGLLDRPAVLAGACAMATILYAGREPERHLDRLRAIIGDGGGVSVWNGKLLARIVAEGGAALQRVTNPSLVELLDGAALPKLWQI
jgi:urease accessory protein